MINSETTKTITIARDFTEYPGPRYQRLGKGSGEEFRDKLFIPAMEKYKQVVVNLDGTRGFGSSFLEETFGGAVRKGVAVNQQNLVLESADRALVNKIWEYITKAANENSR